MGRTHPGPHWPFHFAINMLLTLGPGGYNLGQTTLGSAQGELFTISSASFNDSPSQVSNSKKFVRILSELNYEIYLFKLSFRNVLFEVYASIRGEEMRYSRFAGCLAGR